MRESLGDWEEKDLDFVEKLLRKEIKDIGPKDVFGYALQAIETIRNEKGLRVDGEATSGRNRKPKRHVLKTWPKSFEQIIRGNKGYEVRKNDRGFQVGDELHLKEWDPGRGGFTGREIVVGVTHMTQAGEWGIPDDICVMSIALPVR